MDDFCLLWMALFGVRLKLNLGFSTVCTFMSKGEVTCEVCACGKLLFRE